MAIDTSKRWFKVPGDSKPADRTLDEQMLGVTPALAEAAGKSVLDLGCAEGLIALEFAKAGASRVLGVEMLEYHLEVARRLCTDRPVEFICARLEEVTAEQLGRHDIVLALAIIHKLRDVKAGLELAAGACKDLLVFRGPNYMQPDGWMRSKHWPTAVNVNQTMEACGFRLEAAGPGPRGEPVQRWRRG
jgi:2-polyprenyl-3-methyl-5-hydroxy-6-metoxy-1,4-benzoquinol methylase